MRFGEWLRDQREGRGLSRPRLAELLEASATAIQNWEEGSTPSARNLERIGRWAGKDYNDLMAMVGRKTDFDDQERPLLARVIAASRLLSDEALEPYVVGLEAWARERSRLPSDKRNEVA